MRSQVLLLCFSLAALMSCTRRSTPVAQRHAAPAPIHETVLAIPAEELQILQASRAALAELATRSPKARELLAFYDANAVPAKSVGENAMQVVEVPRPDQPTPFFVYAFPQALRIPTESHQGAVFARFQCHPTAHMMLHGGDLPTFTRGLFLAHELEHARDCLLHGEPDSAPLDPNWLLGELNAHATVNLVLNEWSHNAWQQIVSASRDRREILTRQHGSRPESTLFAVLPEDRTLIAQEFGASDPITLGLLLAQLDVDANILNVNVQMQRYGRPETEFMNHYLEVVQRFYGQHLDTIIGMN